MARVSDPTVLRQIHTVFNIGTIGGLTDGELLERFRSSDLEAAELAFAVLIERHAPMVLRVCQSVLHDRHDAEDAFQATFLILVRRSSSIRRIVRGAMNVMLLSKIKLVLVASALVATGAFVAAKQVGTAIRDENEPVRVAGVSEHYMDSAAVADDDAAVAKEMGRIDLDLLGQEVRDLRGYVAATLREKLRAERSNAPNADHARAAFEEARGTYLATARKLYMTQHRLSNAGVPHEEASDAGTTRSASDRSHVIRPPSAHPAEERPPSAAIGSINMDAVFERYEKVDAWHKEIDAAHLIRRNELMKLQSLAQTETEFIRKLQPGTEDYKRHSVHLTELGARHDAGREQAEAEFNRRRSEALRRFTRKSRTRLEI